MKRLRVAGVQVESRNGEVAGNLARAEPWVARAAAQGAALVLCPELLAAGYVYAPSLWAAGEPRGGPTEAWLRRLARAHAVHLGATYLEAAGEDFFNTFALADPAGRIVGRVRKLSIPACEGWFVRPGDGPRVIETELGRLGVGICNDNQLAAFARAVHAERPDLLLMPHSAPVPQGLGPLGRSFALQVEQIAPHLARGLGVPALLVNKASRAPSLSPFPALPGLRLRFLFPGRTAVCDAEGRLLTALGDEEGLALADVALDPALRRTAPPPTGSYWTLPSLPLPRASAAAWRWLHRAGRRAYADSRARRRAARAISGRRG